MPVKYLLGRHRVNHNEIKCYYIYFGEVFFFIIFLEVEPPLLEDDEREVPCFFCKAIASLVFLWLREMCSLDDFFLIVLGFFFKFFSLARSL